MLCGLTALGACQVMLADLELTSGGILVVPPFSELMGQSIVFAVHAVLAHDLRAYALAAFGAGFGSALLLLAGALQGVVRAHALTDILIMHGHRAVLEEPDVLRTALSQLARPWALLVCIALATRSRQHPAFSVLVAKLMATIRLTERP